MRFNITLNIAKYLLKYAIKKIYVKMKKVYRVLIITYHKQFTTDNYINLAIIYSH